MSTNIDVFAPQKHSELRRSPLLSELNQVHLRVTELETVKAKCEERIEALVYWLIRHPIKSLKVIGAFLGLLLLGILTWAIFWYGIMAFVN